MPGALSAWLASMWWAAASGDAARAAVWIGIADARGTLALKFNLGEGRTRVKERASQAAMELVRRRLMKIE